MTTPSTERKAGPLLGTGSQTTWPFTFKVFAETDIAVTIATSLGVETALVYGVDYDVTLNANQETSPGGTVTYPISGTPLPVGSRLVIVGNLPYDQPLDLPSGGNFSPLALENELDRLTMQIQQLREQVGRALQTSVTTDAGVTLPAPSANELIGWDSTGAVLQNFAVSELATAVAYATMRYDTFAGDGVETEFALTADPVVIANLDVSISGVTQVPGTDYTLVSGSVVFTSAPPNGSAILARYGEGLVNVGGDSSDIRFLQAGTNVVERTVEGKLRETISVKDFGAVGDGVTNDTAAIQAAVDHLTYGGGTVFLPPGTYLVDTIVFPYDNGPTNSNADTTINLIGSGMTSSILLMNSPTNPVIAMSRAVTNFRMTGATFSDFAVKAHPLGSVGNANHIAIDAVGFDAVIFRRIKFMSNGTGSVCMMFRTIAEPQLTYSQVFEGIVASSNVGPAYVVKTQGNGINALSNTNILQVRDCWVYANSDMVCAFDLSACSLYQVINCEIESTGNYGISCGSRGTIIGNWFEAVAIAPLEFVSTIAGSSSQNTIMGNYFSGFSGAIVQPSTDNTSNIFINNTGGNWTLTGPAKKYVIGAGASPAAPVVTKTFGGAGTLTLVAAVFRSIMDQTYELLYTFAPGAAGNFGFTVTPPTGYLNVKMVASAYDGANGVPYACAVEYPNTGFLVTAPNTNLITLHVQVTAQ